MDIQPYDSYRSHRGQAKFTDWLQQTASDLWSNAIQHRFTQDILHDRLPDAVFRSYLIQEYAFVETSTTVTAYATAKAPSMPERAHLTQVLVGLTTDQEDFFQKAFKGMKIPRDAWQTPDLPLSVEAFKDFVVRTAAVGPYEEPLTTMLAAEWMYLTWCQAASQQPSKQPLVRAWVDLHTADAFKAGVDWLRTQLDTLGPALPPERQLRLCRLFRRTLDLEIDFHNEPYNIPLPGP